MWKFVDYMVGKAENYAINPYFRPSQDFSWNCSERCFIQLKWLKLGILGRQQNNFKKW
jgi:hypothetical protein